jgi:LPXTG-motif cell wall-anchored protein
MRMKRTITIGAALVFAGLSLGMTAGAAQATPSSQEPKAVCGTWKARGATGVYPAITFGGKPAGTEITATTAKLTKPTGVNPGVEFAAYDLKVGPLANEVQVLVGYQTAGGASVSAGAVRMFGYEDKNADTINDAPDFQATADAESGNLVFTVAAGKKIGTLGLVFDASNNTTGSVTFSNLMVGDRPVHFINCAQEPPNQPGKPPVSPGPSPTKGNPSQSPSQNPSSPAPSSPAQSIPPPAAGQGGSGPSLPVTGAPVGMITVAGVLVLGTGAGLIFATRRRRVKYTG